MGFLGPKSLSWTLKRVDWRWLWWRTMIRFEFPQQKHNPPHKHPQARSWKTTKCVCLLCFFSRCRAGSRSTRLCSSLPAPRPANTCGSAPWRATPSSGFDNRPPAKPTTVTSRASGPASDSGRAQRQNITSWMKLTWLQVDSLGELWPAPVPAYCTSHKSLCIYGYSVSMVTWICSYGDWDFPFILFAFVWL